MDQLDDYCDFFDFQPGSGHQFNSDLQNWFRDDEQLPKIEKHERKTTDEELTEKEAPQNKLFNRQSRSLSENLPRAFEQLCSFKKKEISINKKMELEYNQVKKGTSQETVNLGKLFKNYIVKVGERMAFLNLLNYNQSKLVVEFDASNGGFQANRKILSCQTIRKQCQVYFRSKQFVRDAMTSTKMNFEKKLILIKYAPQMLRAVQRKSLEDLHAWKRC